MDGFQGLVSLPKCSQSTARPVPYPGPRSREALIGNSSRWQRMLSGDPDRLIESRTRAVRSPDSDCTMATRASESILRRFRKPHGKSDARLERLVRGILITGYSISHRDLGEW